MSERENRTQTDEHAQSQAPITNVRLREATKADWHLLRTWISRPELEPWWGSASAIEAEIHIVFETPSAVARIIECDNAPIGYAHAIDATFWGQDLPAGMPPGTWDIDIVIADPDFRGRGAGHVALNALADEVFSTTMALALSVIVSIKNERAIRAYEKARFKWVRLWDDPIFGASWLLIRQRPK